MRGRRSARRSWNTLRTRSSTTGSCAASPPRCNGRRAARTGCRPWDLWSSRLSCRSSRWLPEHDEILLTVPDGPSVGCELQQLESGREPGPDVGLRMKGRAQVRAGDPGPAHDGLARLVADT